MPEQPLPPLDPRTAGVSALGLIVLALAGYVTITTPEAQQCQAELNYMKGRMERMDDAVDACKDALSRFLPPPKDSP